MEEEKYTAYDLENSEKRGLSSEVSDNTEISENSENGKQKTENGDQSPSESESSEDAGNFDNSANEISSSESEIQRMVEEMGADKVLEIIRGNRNSAIKQIISEISSSREQTLPSGDSVCRTCNSIFDLAALA